jgi:hypothetical protein
MIFESTGFNHIFPTLNKTPFAWSKRTSSLRYRSADLESPPVTPDRSRYGRSSQGSRSRNRTEMFFFLGICKISSLSHSGCKEAFSDVCWIFSMSTCSRPNPLSLLWSPFCRWSS